MTMGLRGRVSVVGVGCSDYYRESPVSVMALAISAIEQALRDAELDSSAIDGVLSYHLGDSVAVTSIVRAFGLPRVRWHNEMWGGGSQSASILIDAAMAIEQGLADTILVYRALHARSGKRLNVQSANAGDGMEAQFILPHGARGPVNTFALVAQRWMYERGHSDGDLFPVIAHQRRQALANPRALIKQSISKIEYMASPMVSSPLRRMDCCIESDGAVAMILMSTERARQLGLRPVSIIAGVRGGGPGGVLWDKAPGLDAVYSRFVANDLWSSAGLGPQDIDAIYPYDAYSFLVPAQIEDFGFCARGEGIAYVDAQVKPINTHGGMLCEGYVHGLNSIAAAMRHLQQKDGDCLPHAETALCTGFGGHYGSALVLQRAG